MIYGVQTGQSNVVQQNLELVGFTSLHFIHTASRRNVSSSSLVQHAVWVVQLAERLHLLSPPVEEILCSSPGPGILLSLFVDCLENGLGEKGALKE